MKRARFNPCPITTHAHFSAIHSKITCNSISRPDQMPNHIIMLSIKLKWPREASCIPNSTLQPISDQSA